MSNIHKFKEFESILKIEYGLIFSEFSTSCEELEKKFQFSIDYNTFNVDLFPGNGKIHIPRSYISFLYYCSTLYKKNLDVMYLVQQFRKAQESKNFETIKHASSIAILGHIYYRNGNKVEFLPVKNGGDLKIDGINVELKTRKNEITKPPENRQKSEIKNNRVDIGNTIIAGITKALRDLLLKSIRQADMVFIDCAEMPFFSMISLPSQEIHKYVQPKKYRVIFYTTTHYSPGTEIEYSDSSGLNKSLGKITAPDLDKFFGTYIDIDPYLWHFLSKKDYI